MLGQLKVMHRTTEFVQAAGGPVPNVLSNPLNIMSGQPVGDSGMCFSMVMKQQGSVGMQARGSMRVSKHLPGGTPAMAAMGSSALRKMYLGSRRTSSEICRFTASFAKLCTARKFTLGRTSGTASSKRRPGRNSARLRQRRQTRSSPPLQDGQGQYSQPHN